VRGDYLLVVQQDGQKVRHGAFGLYVHHAEMRPRDSYFTTRDETWAGDELNITIQTADEFNNLASGTDGDWRLVLWNGVAIETSTLTAEGEGVYQHSMVPTLAGSYVASVSTAGANLGRAPLQIKVWPGEKPIRGFRGLT
jgi:hypothetical protein